MPRGGSNPLPLTVERLLNKSVVGPSQIGRLLAEPCRLWTATVVTARNGDQYGQLWSAGKAHMAHRVSYELNVGPIPDGYEVDHLCCVTLCIEPTHLEAVTPAENKRRTHERGRGRNQNQVKTHCPQGHPYDVVRTRGDGRTFRACRTCERAAQARRKARLAEAVTPSTRSGTVLPSTTTGAR